MIKNKLMVVLLATAVFGSAIGREDQDDKEGFSEKFKRVANHPAVQLVGTMACTGVVGYVGSTSYVGKAHGVIASFVPPLISDNTLVKAAVAKSKQWGGPLLSYVIMERVVASKGQRYRNGKLGRLIGLGLSLISTNRESIDTEQFSPFTGGRRSSRGTGTVLRPDVKDTNIPETETI